MMDFLSIASGSSYVGTGDTHILIDCGISGRKIEEGLNTIGLSIKDMTAVLVTHEHNDHIKGLGVVARKAGVPLYMTKGTKMALGKSVGNIDKDLFCEIGNDDSFSIGDISIRSIPISHDAADPVCFVARCGKKSCGVVTDLGVYDDYLMECISGLDVLLLEANHDVRMLQAGPYPYPLKQRILGERGHLSNESCGRLVCNVLHDGIKQIILGHLSRENNMEELAFETVRSEITMAEDVPYKGTDFHIRVAKRDRPIDVVRI